MQKGVCPGLIDNAFSIPSETFRVVQMCIDCCSSQYNDRNPRSCAKRTLQISHYRTGVFAHQVSAIIRFCFLLKPVPALFPQIVSRIFQMDHLLTSSDSLNLHPLKQAFLSDIWWMECADDNEGIPCFTDVPFVGCAKE